MTYFLRILTLNRTERYISYADESKIHGWKDAKAVRAWAAQNIKSLGSDAHWLAKRIVDEDISLIDVVTLDTKFPTVAEVKAAKLAVIASSEFERYTVLNKRFSLDPNEGKTWRFGYRIYGGYIYGFYCRTDREFLEIKYNTFKELSHWAHKPTNEHRSQARHIRENVTADTDIHPVVWVDTGLSEEKAKAMAQSFRASDTQLGRIVIK